MPDNVHEMWSEGELDAAMATLYPEVQVSTDAKVKARAALMLAARAGEPSTVEASEQTVVIQRRRRRGPLAAVAAAVVVIAVGAVVVVTMAATPTETGPTQQNPNMPRPPATLGSQHAPMPPMPAQPQNSLPSLAARVTETPLGTGQYRYVSSRIWQTVTVDGTSGRQYVYLAEEHLERWIPADQQQEWLQRSKLTGNRRWLNGTEAEALADGVVIRPTTGPRNGEKRARCGEFMYGNGKPCTQQPVGTVDTSSGPARPPSDPRKLYQFLAGTTAKRSDPPADFFRKAEELLDARFPATMRRTALEALGYHPYLVVKDATTGDNRRVVSVSIEFGGGKLRQELLLDPANGQAISKRTVAATDVAGVKAGDTVFEEVVDEAVVNGIGVQPTR
nr:hypothetical protein [Kibdelosporangium sp. MJ126-NF4]CEL21897.1 putative RNA polymerase sigma (70) factor [Kibdelosporangium sp. MJ126-NF4]CTQ92677.1 putative RNA polymerase sigma (70) factor [Kibdelosporangium sp. MJ126-NF4]